MVVWNALLTTPAPNKRFGASGATVWQVILSIIPKNIFFSNTLRI